MPLGSEIGLDPDHILLDGEPAPLKNVAQPPILGPCLLWPNSWMDQDATRYRGRPRPRPRCVRWGSSTPPQKGEQHPQFFAHVYCGQTVAHLSNC